MQYLSSVLCVIFGKTENRKNKQLHQFGQQAGRWRKALQGASHRRSISTDDRSLFTKWSINICYNYVFLSENITSRLRQLLLSAIFCMISTFNFPPIFYKPDFLFVFTSFDRIIEFDSWLRYSTSAVTEHRSRLWLVFPQSRCLPTVNTCPYLEPGDWWEVLLCSIKSPRCRWKPIVSIDWYECYWSESSYFLSTRLSFGGLSESSPGFSLFFYCQTAGD